MASSSSAPPRSAAGSSSSNNNNAAFMKSLVLELVVSSATLFVVLGVMKAGEAWWSQRGSKLDASKSARAAQRKLASINGGGLVTERRAKAVFNHYEDIVAGDMIFPDEIDVSFAEIGGVDAQKKEIYDLVCLPLLRSELYVNRKSDLLQPPRGVLLYGPPGTGKTMMAKAIAKESGAAFINLKLSTAMNMWFGESQKIVHATFSLARKLAPSIIFIDEIDAFLRERRSDDNAASANMKAEFMALWDGIGVDEGGVIVIGATNRPFDVDPAILRRLPRTFEIAMPDAKQREAILRLTLQHERVHVEVKTALAGLAKELVGYSGSDLKELCRAAMTRPFRELIRGGGTEMRELVLSDIKEAMEEVRPTGETAFAYREAAGGEQAAAAGDASFAKGVQHGLMCALRLVGSGGGTAMANDHNVD
jgi:SpoVK/Ycf46/Vps4 family AAA+-type ATPase